MFSRAQRIVRDEKSLNSNSTDAVTRVGRARLRARLCPNGSILSRCAFFRFCTQLEDVSRGLLERVSISLLYLVTIFKCRGKSPRKAFKSSLFDRHSQKDTHKSLSQLSLTLDTALQASSASRSSRSDCCASRCRSTALLRPESRRNKHAKIPQTTEKERERDVVLHKETENFSKLSSSQETARSAASRERERLPPPNVRVSMCACLVLAAALFVHDRCVV